MNRIELPDVLAAFRSPAQFQRELAALIDSRAAGGSRKIVEVGCETAVTTLLLADVNEKTAIDINQRAISLVEAAAAQLNKKVTTLVCDMFSMPFRDAAFDIVFNAGVIEHFSKEERARALFEYSRVMKDDGLMIIALPNHYCPPYRFAYPLLSSGNVQLVNAAQIDGCIVELPIEDDAGKMAHLFNAVHEFSRG